MSHDLKEMLSSAVHFGRKTSKWNPKMSPYLYGQKDGIHIFDLKQTASCLDEAEKFAEKIASEGKIILVVSTKPQTFEIIPEKCKKTNLPYVIHKWFAGLLTNFPTIKSRIRYLKKMKDMAASGEIERYTKNEQVKIRKEIGKLQNALGGVEEMTKKPDALFVTDVMRDETAIKEAVKLNIPVIGICDSNANPEKITYPIPGNVRSIKSLEYIIDSVFGAIEKGQISKPKQEAKPAPKKDDNKSEKKDEKKDEKPEKK